MIVPTMTIDEIYQEIVSERAIITQQKSQFLKAFRKVVLKATKFPIVKYFTITTPKKKNQYIFQFVFSKRSTWENPNM